MKYTSNYSLRKPDTTDIVDVNDFNTNVDKIDAEIKKVNESLTNSVSDLTSQLDSIEIKKATNTRVDELERQIGQGVTDEQLEEAIQNKIDDGSISSLAVGNNSVKKDNIKINAVTYDKTDFITTGKNLFNKNKITDNSYLSPTNGGIGSSNLTCITDFIKCIPSTQYSKTDKTTNYVGVVCFYDENRNFISGVENATTFTTPSNCYYFRTTIWKTVHPISSYQIEKGSITTTYESYYNTFSIPKVEKIKEKYCVIYGGSILIDVHSGVVTTSNVSVLINREISSTSWSFTNLDIVSSEINISSYISQSHFLFNICLIKNESGYSINVLPYSGELTGNDYVIATFNYLNNEIISLSKDFIKFKNSESTTEETLTLVVKKDGTGDYDNLRKCFDYIESVITNYNNFEVELHEGTYNVRDYFTDDEWKNVNISVGSNIYYGLTVPNKTKLIGVGNVDNIIITGSSTINETIKSTLNFKDTSSIENVTVKAKNLRYVVHDDMAWQGKKYERHCKHCKFIGQNLTYRSAYGSGTYGNANWVFEDCLFQVDNEYPPFSNHNTANMLYPSELTFENCTFVSTSPQDLLLTSFTPNALTYVNLKGCNLKGIKLNELEGNSGIAFRVKGYGNTQLNNIIENTDGKSYTIDIIS